MKRSRLQHLLAARDDLARRARLGALGEEIEQTARRLALPIVSAEERVGLRAAERERAASAGTRRRPSCSAAEHSGIPPGAGPRQVQV